jgi:hypothetical protein
MKHFHSLSVEQAGLYATSVSECGSRFFDVGSNFFATMLCQAISQKRLYGSVIMIADSSTNVSFFTVH